MLAEAFEALVRQNRDALYRGSYRLTGNHEDAQDFLQEALVEAFAAFARFRLGTHFTRWVMRIMTRTSSTARGDDRRSSSSRWTSRGRPAKESSAATCPTPGSLPKRSWCRRTARGPLQEALMALPPEFRLAVVLCDVQGSHYEEAARAARCPVGTIRSRLHRGRG